MLRMLMTLKTFINNHDLSTMAHSLKNIAILTAKGTRFRCILMGVSKNEGLNRLNNSVTYDRRVLRI